MNPTVINSIFFNLSIQIFNQRRFYDAYHVFEKTSEGFCPKPAQSKSETTLCTLESVIKAKIQGKKLYKIIHHFWTKKEGGKSRIQFKRLGLAIIASALFLVILLLFLMQKDTSYIEETNTPFVASHKDSSSSRLKKSKVDSLFESEGLSSSKKGNTKRRSQNLYGHGPATHKAPRLKYRAKQVILRSDGHQGAGASENTLPTGTNLVGQLLTAIDTRDKGQRVKVILPYGGTFKNQRILARNTVLLGRIRYLGRGEKVFVSLGKGVTPEGREFALKAQALSSKDYSSGLLGDYHSQTDLRLFGAVGLSMLSRAGDVLTEREALSEGTPLLPKPP